MNSNERQSKPTVISTKGLLIKQITPLCQLQDLGRFAYKKYGVTHSGAVDPYLLRVANSLVGNSQNTACLEFTLAGGEFVVTAQSVRLAFAGDFPVVVNGNSQSTFCSFVLKRGDILNVQPASNGIRGYLAIAGGFSAEPELGSYSTHSRSGLGGFDQELTTGVTLGANLTLAVGGQEYYLRESLRRKSRDSVRVVLGPQTEYFTKQGIADFLSKPFVIANDSDRMGYRLENNKIEHASDANIISDPTIPGSIQVPASGNPVVLMADCPTTGGYPKIATVVSVDLGLLAQKAAGAELVFQDVSIECAQSLFRDQARDFKTLAMRLDTQ